MRGETIGEELLKYEEAFGGFVHGYGLPKELFVAPDHLAIKCADELDYLTTCDDLRSVVTSDGFWEFPEGGRLLASAELDSGASLCGFTFNWLEVMQPRPGKETDAGFVEHTEFYTPDLFAVAERLKKHGVEFTAQKNPGHSWLNVVIDEVGREIKFNDKPLAEVVAAEKKPGPLGIVGDE